MILDALKDLDDILQYGNSAVLLLILIRQTQIIQKLKSLCGHCPGMNPKTPCPKGLDKKE